MNISPRKSLGQNFLHSGPALNKIIEAGKIQKGDTILEIGPGKGSLTEKLLESGALVVAIEKDRRLQEYLQEKFSNEIKSKQLTLVEGDILDIDISKLISQPYKVIANIPYYITGEIIRTFLTHQNPPTSMVLLIQKEVADRIVARDKKESILSISVKAYGSPKKITTVKAGSFYPKPKVDSAILLVDNISKENFRNIEEYLFFSIVKAGFSSKRKQLHKNLKKVLTEPQKALLDCGIDPQARAEDLDISKWKCLASLK